VQTFAESRYRIERSLGHGGMAIVYLAHDRELNRPVALKVLAEQYAQDETFRARFVREAQIAARLAHPNVVQVFDVGEEEGRPYIVMECVEGETLADVLRRRGKLPPAEARDLALQACAGLAHAHGAGLVHRDVKPQNLILRADGTLKVADFGIARAVESTTQLTQVGTVLGTAAYLSPEQAAGEEVTPASDVYSLGAVLYELLTGRPPHTFESLSELALKQREGLIQPARDIEPEVPEELEAAVMRMLARDVRFRPRSAAEAARELEAASPKPPTKPLTGEPATRPLGLGVPSPTTAVHVPPPRRTTISIPLERTGRWLAYAAAAALLAIVLGLLKLGGGGESSRSRASTTVPLAATTAPTPSTPAPSAAGAVPRGRTAAEEARNLAAWLRRNSASG
jgi:serine/threonine-protein kinase